MRLGRLTALATLTLGLLARAGRRGVAVGGEGAQDWVRDQHESSYRDAGPIRPRFAPLGDVEARKLIGA